MAAETASTSTEDMEFTTVTAKRRLSTGSEPDSPEKTAKKGPAAIVLSNAYSVLADDEDAADTAPIEDTPAAPPKKTKIPPVIINNLNTHKALEDMLKDLCQSEFTIKPRATNSKLILTTVEDYKSVTDAFKKQAIEHYTFPLERKSVQRFVIRGLPANAAVEEIAAELADNGFPVRNIIQLTSPADKKKKYPLFLVTLTARADGKPADISTITRLCSCKITTEEPRAKRGPKMCFNCQRLGHTSEFCHQKPRCVCCGEAHTSRDCQRDRETPATCANCGGAHPASYRGCPYLAKARNEDNRPPQRPKPGNPTTSKRPEPATPASRTPTPTAQQHPAPHTLISPTQPGRPNQLRPEGRYGPGTAWASYSDILKGMTAAPAPAPASPTSDAVDWTQLIVKIATIVAEMNIHPMVTTVASLIVRILQSEQGNQHGSKD